MGKISKIVEKYLKKEDFSCPGSKIRSKGKGRGLGRGEGKGPIGVPYRNQRFLRRRTALTSDEVIVGRKYYVNKVDVAPSIRGPIKSDSDLLPVIVVWKDLDSNVVQVRYGDKDFEMTVDELISAV